MPDASFISIGTAAAAVVAAAVTLLCFWLLRSGRLWLAWLAEVLAFGLGFGVGCWRLDVLPHLSLVEDEGRLLVLLLPLTAIIELVAALRGPRAWSGRVLRFGLALLTPALMLAGSGYLPGGEAGAPATWTSGQAATILLGLGVSLAVAWILLDAAARRPGGYAVPAAVGLAAAATGACMMLSGYASGGFLGLAVGGAVAGIVAAGLLVARMADVVPLVGLSLIALFGLLMGGRFFGELTTTNAVLLFVAPLLCWAAAPLRKLKPAARFCVTLLVCFVPAAVAVGLAYHTFAEATDETSGYSSAGSTSDAPLAGAKGASGTRASDAAAAAGAAGPSSAPSDPGAEEPGSPSGANAKPSPRPKDPGDDFKK
jgi:hypothetical protein